MSGEYEVGPGAIPLEEIGTDGSAARQRPRLMTESPDYEDHESPVAVERRLQLAVSMLDAAVVELRELMAQLQHSDAPPATTSTTASGHQAPQSQSPKGTQP